MEISKIKSQLELVDRTFIGPFAYQAYEQDKFSVCDSHNLNRAAKHKAHIVFSYHLEYEIIRVITGKLTLIINEHSYSLRAGQYAWIASEQLHRIEFDKDKEAPTYESIFFDLPSIVSSFHDHHDFLNLITSCHIMVNPIFDIALSEDEPVCQHMNMLFNSIKEAHKLEGQSHGYQSFAQRSALDLIATGQLLACLGMIELKQRYTSYEDKLNSNLKKSLRKSVVLMRYIYEHYSTALTLDDLAKVADLQPNYLCRYFKELTGKRPFDYINQLRINEATNLLAHSSQSIYQIAYACGFQDPCYFTRIFKKHMKLSPSDYRKLIKAK